MVYGSSLSMRLSLPITAHLISKISKMKNILYKNSLKGKSLRH